MNDSVEGLWRIKLRRWARLWFAAWRRDTLAPCFDRRELFRFLSTAAFITLLFVFWPIRANEELTLLGVGWVAVFVLLPVWIVLNGVLAPFRVWNDEQKKGRWIGRRFQYLESQLVSLTPWTVADNGKTAEIIFDDAEPNSSVVLRTEILGAPSRTHATVSPYGMRSIFDLAGLPRNFGNGSGSVRVDQHRKATLWAEQLPGSDPATIRIFMESWEV